MSTYDAILLAGPTASGKSPLALELAASHNGVIINADSMQVYAELRVLTARPSPEDEASAPHALYGFVSAATRYSVGAWLGAVAGVLSEAREEGRLPIVVGG
ncbi:MAG: tRNA (adenosine(37)-N6)-dimethylallyltransferase MiaA, partial [Bauldia sp.]|nr:tRNA (adenosine(37)-N6)-dimethylallyltransferase MiaA [Bauldia sp.]